MREEAVTYLEKKTAEMKKMGVDEVSHVSEYGYPLTTKICWTRSIRELPGTGEWR